MVDVYTEVLIQCPIDKVANYAADPDNAPHWYVNIKSAEWRTDKPLQVGSRIAFIAHFLGRKMAYTYEVTEFVPHSKMVMRTADGPFEMSTTYEWHPEPGGLTKMSLRNAGAPTGFSRIVAPFMASAMKRANRKDLLLLKSILEGN